MNSELNDLPALRPSSFKTFQLEGSGENQLVTFRLQFLGDPNEMFRSRRLESGLSPLDRADFGAVFAEGSRRSG